MALTVKRAAFFDVDNTLIRGSTLYFLGKGMYQRVIYIKKGRPRNCECHVTTLTKLHHLGRFMLYL